MKCLGLALAGALVFGVTACAPGSNNATSTPAEPTKVSKDVAALGDITLTVWDQEVRGSQNDAIVKLNEEFQKKYPNVTINRVTSSFDDLTQQLTLALSGDDVPDVAQVNNARGDMGEFVKAGQLANLEPWAELYGWTDRFAPSVLSKTRYSADATTFGEGNLYGIPQSGELVGIFYNIEKLDKLGISLPQTWEEYLVALDKAKAAGEQPMVLGNIEKWPAIHVFGSLQAHYVPVDDIVKLGMGNAGSSWITEQNTQALAQLAAWGHGGYFGSSPNGTDYDPAWASFAKGTGVFLPAGSWLGTDLEKQMGDNLGFMVPPPGVDGTLATTGGTGIPFAIPAKAKNPVAAAAYIDFITSDEAMEMIAENGGMPVNRTIELAPASGVQKQIFEGFGKVANEGTLLPYLDYATPTFSDTVGEGLQKVLGSQSTPEQVLKDLEADYSAFTQGK
ncbi:MAG: extracellular solute-binding protein [Actinomycetaceae bacterium]|nr:extracellular solute-binding protein [Actinomycetaceae bacterium]